MKIAYILYPEVIISNKSNGVRSQAFEWASILKSKSVEVDLVNNWGDYDWREYDAIHIFGCGLWLRGLTHRLSAINERIVISPIIDPITYKSKLFNIEYLRSRNRYLNRFVYNNRCAFKNARKLCVRSNFELSYISDIYRIPEDKFSLIPLSYDARLESENYELNEKEDFCLHISSIFQERKNVLRLIEAAKKYNFKLVLAGNKGSESQFAAIANAIEGYSNISVLGFITHEQKIELYKKAKVFALPSIQEGVGIVALDAAKLGCEIVITNIEGPKEYYDKRCIEINPYSVDSIGEGIRAILDGEKKFQPNLSQYVSNNYSPDIIGKHLIELYMSK